MADEAENTGNINQEFNKAVAGIDMDSTIGNMKKGSLTYALNANLENFDSNSVSYQNEPGTEICFDFPEGYKVVGRHFIPEQTKIIFMLSNPQTGDSEIGYSVNNDCVYRKLVNAVCLNFDVTKPIQSIVHRVTNFGTEIYWPDNNGRRYLNIDEIPYTALSTDSSCDLIYTDELDCNKIKLQPNINIPVIDVIDVISGGGTVAGTYQFTVQYADATGNPYTSFYGVTNPTPIADVNLATVNFDYQVGKSIVLDISNLEPLGQYQHFNLAVTKTINGISSHELVGTYFIDRQVKQIIYTGENQSPVLLSSDELFERFTYYRNADYVTAVQDILVWKGVTAAPRLNYQHIANKIELQWQSYRIPTSEGYSNEVNATNLRSYLRDEIYAIEIIFLLDNGMESDGFHIPGRKKGTIELARPNIKPTDPDFIGTPDRITNDLPYWKIYNTATVQGTAPEYDPFDDDYKGPYQYGEMAYWESYEEYPCDEDMWGELSGKKIRHHKLPDVLVSPLIESPDRIVGEALEYGDATAIFALGLSIDSDAVKNIIESSDLTVEQKNEIIGYKIVRADRGVNKSIIAKGMLRNVGKYEKEQQTYYYPNYPYNDVKGDVFLNSVNNAWSAQCEEFTIEVLELPLQPDGEHYVEISFKSCNTNKPEFRKIKTLGLTTECAIGRPKFISRGRYDKMVHGENGSSPYPGDLSFSGLDTSTATQAFLYPSNYQEWIIWWRKANAGGLVIRWEDIVMGEQTEWLTGPASSIGIWGERIKMRTPIGQVPECADKCIKTSFWDKGRKIDIELLRTVEVVACKDETPLQSIEDTPELASRQIFNSPETSFGQPFLGNILKLESVMYGGGKAHFAEVNKNAKYKLLTKEAQIDALRAAEDVTDLTTGFNLDVMFKIFNTYLQIYLNGITRKNYAQSFNSIASYNRFVPIPNNQGIKQRNLDIKRYLTPHVLSVGDVDGEIFNNFQRETSVFLKTSGDDLLPLPHLSTNMLSTGIEEYSRFTISDEKNCSVPKKEVDISVISYYGSLKNEFINQYGQIYSYTKVDTGFIKLFNTPSKGRDMIFGGDTFIGKFAYKTKLPFFIDNRVNAPDDSDIFYDEIGNIAYPKYWHSSRSILETYRPGRRGLVLTNFISYKANNFDCKNSQELHPPSADPSTNPDRTFYDGYYYLFAYGVPSFYCESSYNLDLRTAFNNREGDFWPHVSTGIPDDWVQEDYVSIANDNTYNYNSVFSKQNRESSFANLPADWGDISKRTEYPFRTIYSDKQITDADNRVNNWLTYRPISYFDFPQNYGKLIALDSLKNASILARFENKSLLYNNLLTLDTENSKAVYIGNNRLFSNAPPFDYAETDQGYAGTQNKLLLKTPYGALTLDAKRGQIFLIGGTELKDLTVFGSGMGRWFSAHLPFEILKYFPEVDTDNHYNGIGIHGVYDSNYERIILTKLDYIPLIDGIELRDGKYYYHNGVLEKEIYLHDTDYFSNVSWTISYSFISNSWVSFHSYLPNWYVGENNFFYSGLNVYPNDFEVFAGVLDPSISTTTTTTERYIPTTTSTTTIVPRIECKFNINVEITDCDLEGRAVFVGSWPDAPCIRDSGLNQNILFNGYEETNNSTVHDTTVSSEAACTNLSYFNMGELLPSYLPTYVRIVMGNYGLGAKIYLDNNSIDCQTVPDGWYFVDMSSEDNEVFLVQNGFIVEIKVCGGGDPVSPTTTTTTTVLPGTSICITGMYPEGNLEHPFGGYIAYLDIYGVEQLITGIFSGDTHNITYSEILGSHDIENC